MSVVELQNELKNYYWNSRYEIWKENPWLNLFFGVWITCGNAERRVGC